MGDPMKIVKEIKQIMFYCATSGERVVGRGSDLYQLCKDIDDTIKGMYFCAFF